MADDSATMALHEDTITVAAASVTHASPSALGGHDQGDLAHELYMLSTNFLLYVALVIVTAMLQRIYFPETFERPAQPPSDVEYYSVPAPGGGGGEDGEDGEDAENQDAASLLPPKRSGKKPQRSVSWSTLAQVVDVTAGPDNETLTKKDVFGRLVACFFGLNVPFVIWGVMQERLLTRPYRGEYFIYSYGLVFLNRCISFVISGGLMLAVKPNLSSSITYEFSFPSVTNMLSSWCQYEALKCVERTLPLPLLLLLLLLLLLAHRATTATPPLPPPYNLTHSLLFQVRDVSHPAAVQVLQNRAHHAHGQVPRQQVVRAPRLRRRRAHRRRHRHLHDVDREPQPRG